MGEMGLPCSARSSSLFSSYFSFSSLRSSQTATASRTVRKRTTLKPEMEAAREDNTLAIEEDKSQYNLKPLRG